MPICKITVLKKLFNAELAETYRRSDVHYGTCPYYEEGKNLLSDILVNGQTTSSVTGPGTTWINSF